MHVRSSRRRPETTAPTSEALFWSELAIVLHHASKMGLRQRVMACALLLNICAQNNGIIALAPPDPALRSRAPPAVAHRRRSALQSAFSSSLALLLLPLHDDRALASDDPECADCRLSAGPPVALSSSSSSSSSAAPPPPSSSPLARQVDAVIASSDVVVFGKTWCPYCKATAATLDRLGFSGVTTTIYLDRLSGDDGPRVQAELFRRTGQRTVPNVFVKGSHLGGNEETQAAATSGALKAMLL